MCLERQFVLGVHTMFVVPLLKQLRSVWSDLPGCLSLVVLDFDETCRIGFGPREWCRLPVL